MQILTVLTYRQPKSERHIIVRSGFTLIEVIVVIVILSLSVMISAPALFSFLEDDLDKETNNIVSTLRQLRQKAILEQHSYRMVFSIDDKSYWFEKEIQPDEYEALEETQFALRTLPDDWELRSIRIDGKLYGRLRIRPIYLNINPLGLISQFMIELKIGDNSWYIVSNGLTGRAKLLDERQYKDYKF